MRCTLAAVTIAFLQDLIGAVGIGWTYTLMGGLCGIAMALFCLDYHVGPAWRRKSLSDVEAHHI